MYFLHFLQNENSHADIGNVSFAYIYFPILRELNGGNFEFSQGFSHLLLVSQEISSNFRSHLKFGNIGKKIFTFLLSEHLKKKFLKINGYKTVLVTLLRSRIWKLNLSISIILKSSRDPFSSLNTLFEQKSLGGVVMNKLLKKTTLHIIAIILKRKCQEVVEEFFLKSFHFSVKMNH